jgi:hypothetical protein
VLPLVFVAIFGTVVVYGLTAAPVARALGVAGAGRRLVLVVGGHPWAQQIATALEEGGVAVRLWVGQRDQQEAARKAGLTADRGRIMLDAISREAELEEVTEALVLTGNDDFNTLGAAQLRAELGHHHVFRVAPHPDQPDLLPPLREYGILGDRSLTFTALDRRFAEGAKILTRKPEPGQRVPDRAGEVALFAVTQRGRLRVATDGHPLDVHGGDVVIVLSGAE